MPTVNVPDTAKLTADLAKILRYLNELEQRAERYDKRDYRRHLRRSVIPNHQIAECARRLASYLNEHRQDDLASFAR